MLGESSTPTQPNYAALPYPKAPPLVGHAQKMGVRLRTFGPAKRPVMHRGKSETEFVANLRPSGKGLVSAYAWTQMPLTPEFVENGQYISDLVVPLESSRKPDTVKVRTATSAPILRNQTSYPSHRHNFVHPRLSGTPANTRRSSSMQNYLQSSESPEHHLLRQTPKTKRWNQSEQALRYEAERNSINRIRQVKHDSQMQSHRVNRLYFMAGQKMEIKSKYDIDSSEHQQLKEIKQAREQAPYYGRGLSKYKYFDVPSGLTSTPNSTPAPNFGNVCINPPLGINPSLRIDSRDHLEDTKTNKINLNVFIPDPGPSIVPLSPCMTYNDYILESGTRCFDIEWMNSAEKRKMIDQLLDGEDSEALSGPPPSKVEMHMTMSSVVEDGEQEREQNYGTESDRGGRATLVPTAVTLEFNDPTIPPDENEPEASNELQTVDELQQTAREDENQDDKVEEDTLGKGEENEMESSLKKLSINDTAAAAGDGIMIPSQVPNEPLLQEQNSDSTSQVEEEKLDKIVEVDANS